MKNIKNNKKIVNRIFIALYIFLFVVGGFILFNIWQQSSSNAGGEKAIGTVRVTPANSELLYAVSSDTNPSSQGLYGLKIDSTVKKLPLDGSIQDVSQDKKWVLSEGENPETKSQDLVATNVSTNKKYYYGVDSLFCEESNSGNTETLVNGKFSHDNTNSNPPSIYYSVTLYGCDSGSAQGVSRSSTLHHTRVDGKENTQLFQTNKLGTRLYISSVQKNETVFGLQYENSKVDSFVWSKHSKIVAHPAISSISENGKVIAYKKSNDTYISSVEGSGEKKARTVGLVDQLQLNPDASKLAYTSYSKDGLKQQLYLLDIKTNENSLLDNVTTLKSKSQTFSTVDLEWAADGSYIAYPKRDYVSSTYEIARVAASGGNPETVEKLDPSSVAFIELYY